MIGFLGTILPTRKTLRDADTHRQRVDSKRERIGQEELGNCGCIRQVIGGEVRWYDGDLYAVVRDNGEILWFQVRADGDYALGRHKIRRF